MKQRTYTIFLASSNRFKKSIREKFSAVINNLNNEYQKYGVFLQDRSFEHLSTVMSREGSQTVYNEIVKCVDIFIVGYDFDMGIHTLHEFYVAKEAFLNDSKKPKIFIIELQKGIWAQWKFHLEKLGNAIFQVRGQTFISYRENLENRKKFKLSISEPEH